MKDWVLAFYSFYYSLRSNTLCAPLRSMKGTLSCVSSSSGTRARTRVLSMFLLLNLFLRQLCRPLPFLDRDRQAEWGYEKEWSPFGQGLRSWPFKSRTKAGNRRRSLRKRDREVRVKGQNGNKDGTRRTAKDC